MKKFLAVLLALLMVLSLAACAGGSSDSGDDVEAPADDGADAQAPADEGDGDAPQPVDKETLEDTSTWDEWEQELAGKWEVTGDEKFTWGMTIMSFTDKFGMRVLNEAKNYTSAAFPNVTLLEGDGEFDANIQIGLIENWIAQQVDCVLLVAVDSEACGSICDMLENADIKLVTPNTEINCGDPDCKLHNFVGSDHYYSGQLQAEYMIENVDDTETVKICYLEGTNGFTHATLRKAGFLETLDKSGYNYELLSSLEGEYMRDTALYIAEDWFTRFGDEIDAIVAANDEMAWGALEAMKGAGLSGVVICGIDCNDDTKDAIESGEIAMTVYQNAEGQGKWGAIAAYNACLGNPTGDIDIPYEPVTKDNLAEYR